MKLAERILSMNEKSIKVSGDDAIETVNVDKIYDGNKGWKVAQKGDKNFISKDGRIFIEVDKDHPALKK